MSEDGVARLSVRRARPEDAAQVLVWRNDPVTRAMSRTSAPLDPETHHRWWAAADGDPDLILLIGQADGRDVGVLGFSRQDAAAWEAWMHLGPQSRGRGWATPLLRAAIAQAFPDGAPRLLAEIKPGNAASRRVFETAGFREQGAHGEVLLYERPAA